MKKCVFGFVLAFFIHGANAITYKNMDDMCGGSELDLDRYDSVGLRLTAFNFYKKLHCSVSIKTNSNSRMMFYFKSYSVSCKSELLVFDGKGPNDDYVSGLKGKKCGHSISSNVFRTTGNNLYLRFINQYTSIYNGFDMVITSFHTGSCESDEYSCRNGRCISDTLNCNGYNPCGDYSDCAYIMAAGVIAGIVISSIAFIVTVTAVVVLVCRRRRIAYAGRTVGQPMGVVTTTTTTPGTTGFGQPYPQQHPSQQASAYPVGQQYPGNPYSQY